MRDAGLIVRAGTGSSSDLNVELWRSLVIASGNQLFEAASSTSEALASGAARLRRLVEAPPSGKRVAEGLPHGNG